MHLKGILQQFQKKESIVEMQIFILKKLADIQRSVIYAASSSYKLGYVLQILSHLHLLLEGLIVSLTNSIGLHPLQQKEKVTQRWQMMLPLVVCCIPTYSCKVNPVDYDGGVGGRRMICGLDICIQN
jgi:hypothetical protein